MVRLCVFYIQVFREIFFLDRDRDPKKISRGKLEYKKPSPAYDSLGPTDYVPSVEVEVMEKRTAIPLDENEGIYVRDIKTGKVRAVTNETYMLKPNEELWKKELPKIVEELLVKEKPENEAAEREKTRVVTYRAPHNSAVQIYDYKEKKSRVVFGPGTMHLWSLTNLFRTYHAWT